MTGSPSFTSTEKAYLDALILRATTVADVRLVSEGEVITAPAKTYLTDLIGRAATVADVRLVSEGEVISSTLKTTLTDYNNYLVNGHPSNSASQVGNNTMMFLTNDMGGPNDPFFL